jgi:hypothetical protein
MRRGTALLAVTVSALLVLAACGEDDPGAVDSPDRVRVRAELIDAPEGFSVEVSPVEDANGGLRHEVSVTWDGEGEVVLDDARFGHHVDDPAGDGALVTSGRGCGAEWDEENRHVLHICTADLQIIALQPGETHNYPVVIYPEVGPLRLLAGTYVIDEEIAWWRSNGEPIAAQGQEPEGALVLRLSYDVQ